ncbi:hypothetical protein QJQ45_010120 [Haematococcus lacustris]|nr:hypothetical protein QJQ45_010120 [Haematococcus lacustris]
MQEMKMPEAKITKDVACLPGYESFWAVSRERLSYSGVTTWCRSPGYSPLAAQADCLAGGDSDLDREGRMVLVDLQHWVLINVYVPNAGDKPGRERLEYKMRFLEALKDKMYGLRAAGRQVIVVGDFNIAPQAIDMHPSLGSHAAAYSAAELDWVRCIMRDFPDAWRSKHPAATDCFTVWEERTSARAFNAGCRIDLILLSPELLPQVLACDIVTDVPPKWSDHAPVLLELSDVPLLQPHAPCALSSSRMPRFNQQRSIATMFKSQAQARTASASQQLSSTAPLDPDRSPPQVEPVAAHLSVARSTEALATPVTAQAPPPEAGAQAVPKPLDNNEELREHKRARVAGGSPAGPRSSQSPTTGRKPGKQTPNAPKAAPPTGQASIARFFVKPKQCMDVLEAKCLKLQARIGRQGRYGEPVAAAARNLVGVAAASKRLNPPVP